MINPPLLDTAMAAHAAGLCVVPPKQDGSKMPIGKAYTDENGEEQYGWTPWQSEMSTLDEIRAWYERSQKTGVGFVCGAVSGNLELFEFDCRLTYERFRATAEALGRGDLIARIEAGYRSDTPGGGVHWLTRCDEIAGNTKLASRPKRPEEKKHPNDNVQVLIETRGEGGYTVEAPSNGKVHPTGGMYRLVSGGVGTITRLSPAERRFLWDLAETFDEMPESAPTADAEPRYRFDDSITFEPVREAYRQGVIEDFNARSTWDEVLRPHGWEFTKQVGQVQYVRRPGKDGGQSGTINFGGSDKLCVFSSSTDFKQTDRKGAKAGYDKFGAYAVLNHRGDQKAAYHDLSDRGYGTEWTPSGAASATSGTFGTTSQQNNDDAWGDPDPLLEAALAPELPLDLFPREIRDVALDAAERIRCPVDYTAWSLLVSEAGLIGRGVGFRPRLYDDWTERAVLWLVLIGPPSWMKSPALEAGIRPLRRRQQQLAEQHRDAVERWQADCAAIKAENARRKAEKSREAPDELPPKPVMQRCITTDVTVEKLGELLLPDVSSGMTVHRDELAGVVHDLNRYRNGSDREFYLQAYSGGVYFVDRIARGEQCIPDLLFNIAGGIQPEVAQAIFGSGPDDGLSARFTAVWPNGPPGWKKIDREPDRAARDRLDAINDRLVGADWSTLLHTDDYSTTPYCRPDVQAYDQFSDWEAKLMTALRAGHYEGRAESRAGKYRGLAARIALVLHLVNWAAGRVVEPKVLPFTTVAAATGLLDRYVIPMERRVFGEYATPPAALGARRIARWIVRERRERFTVREIRRHHWSDLTEESDVLAALDWLVTAGWVRELERDTSRIGRPPIVFCVNPKAHEQQA